MPPTRVLLAFPPVVADDLVDRLRAVSPELEITVCSYAEPHENRSARGNDPAAAAQLTAPVVTDEQRDALAVAEVVLALDLPVGVTDLAPGLRWVQVIGAGVDHLRGVGLGEQVTVTNAAGVAAVPIAEFVIGRLLQVWKRFDEMGELQRRHEWEPTYGRLVAGSTIALVGLGAIGGAVAERARALDMHVIGIRRSYTPGATSPLTNELFGPDALHEVLGRADAVVLSAPSTPETQDLFDANAFAAMKPGSVFCNVARGALVDEDALIATMRAGHLHAAILDVTRAEPLPADSPLWDVPGILISPHSAASLDRYMEALFGLFADNLGRYRRGEALRNVVDLAAGY
jgi:phosphoglycerate dehydrogenase-like enzyme